MLIRSVVPLQSGPQVLKFTIPYTALQAPGTSNSATFFTLPAKARIVDAFAIVTTAFAGTGITAVTLSCGPAGNLTKYLPAGSISAVNNTLQPSAAIASGLESASATTAIEWSATSTGAFLSALSAGSIDIYLTLVQAA